MDFPPEIIAKTLSGFCICHFKNSNHDPEAPPHYYVTVPIDDNSSLLLCIITSQLENKLWYYHRTDKTALSSLVRVTKHELPFLKKESVIECNQPLPIRKVDFGKIIDPDHQFKIITRRIPSDIKKKIVKAIKNSPIVKPFIKKLVKYP